MLKLIRTDSNNKDFKRLVRLLNSDLATRDGADHPLSQFNKIDEIKHAILVYDEGEAIGCGAITHYDQYTMELKRIYVTQEARGKKVGNRVLLELENWILELSKNNAILFMGVNQPEARNLYEKNGYHQIPNYGKLKAIAENISYAKNLESI